jgi:hypothetical protein
MRQCDWKRGSYNGYMAPVTMWNRLSRCGSCVDPAIDRERGRKSPTGRR